jgi:hypothetical protein
MIMQPLLDIFVTTTNTLRPKRKLAEITSKQFLLKLTFWVGLPLADLLHQQ